MSEKIVIEIDSQGMPKVKRDLIDLGVTGSRAAEDIKQSFRKALNAQNAGSTNANLSQSARIAMNSFKLAEAEKVATAKKAAADIAASASVAAEAKMASERAATVAAAANQAAAAASAKSAAAARATAARLAEKEIQAAKRATAAADARFVAEERNRATGLRRAQTRMAQEAAKAEVKAAREASKAKRDLQQKDREAGKIVRGQGGGLVMGAIAAVGLGTAVREFAELSDSMTNARNRLAIVSRGTADVADAMTKLKKVSLDTRSDFDLTTRSYARTSQALKALHTSSSENIQITKTLQQAIAVSGATNEEAHATLIQLTQAMASNRLSADEFRSVAEQLPAVLDMIAKATGKPRTELKKLGEAGALTAAVLAFSILSANRDMEAAFAKTMPTISQQWTNLGTQVKFAIDQFNTATGASQGIVHALKFIGEHTDTAVKAFQILAGSALPLVIWQVGLLSKALMTLAISNPWVLALAAVGGLGAALYMAREDFEGPKGRAMTPDEYNAFKERQKLKPGTEEFKKAEKTAIMQKAIDEAHFRKLQAQAKKDIETAKKNGKKGPSQPYVPTFDEAIADLSAEVENLSADRAARRDKIDLMKVEDQMQRSMTQAEIKAGKTKDDIRIHLNATEEKTVLTLSRMKKALMDKEATEKALFKYHFEREEEISRQMEEQAKRRFELIDQEQDRRERLAFAIKHNDFSGFTDGADIEKTRELIAGRPDANKLRQRLEIQDPNTKPERKAFLEEVNGIGKFKADLDSIFGPEGSIATGFSRATASSIVFHKSFKNAIHDLGQSIQVEILQALIQSLTRMAILSMTGGATPSLFTGDIFRGNPYGKASGGFAAGGRGDVAGFHHGGEFIVNANATAQNRAMLESMNAGKPVVAKSSSGVNVSVHNYAGVSVETRQMGPNDVTLIVRRMLAEEGPRMMAGSISDANSPLSRSIGKNTNAQRSR